MVTLLTSTKILVYRAEVGMWLTDTKFKWAALVRDAKWDIRFGFGTNGPDVVFCQKWKQLYYTESGKTYQAHHADISKEIARSMNALRCQLPPNKQTELEFEHDIQS